MKSDIDIKDDVYALLVGSELEQSISGSIVKTLRPANSTKEDVVISILANENAEIQEAFVNVNVYVNDIAITYNEDGEKITQYEEDTKRLREICNICKDIFELHVGDTYRITLDSQRVLPATNAGAHIVNNKLLYKNF